MPKKVLITLSLMGAALCNQDYMKTVFAEESRPSALLERSSVKIAITMENLNLRDKASTSGRILTTIPKGKTVTILSEKDENGWYKVSYDGKTGYVSGSYLTTSTSSSTTITTKTGTTTENLNLRDQASTSGKILTTIPKGKTVTILSEKDENGWYKVSYDGKTGYVSGSYLTTSTSNSTTITTKTGTTIENLNLRDQASLTGKILMTIPKGKTVTILAEKDENGWYKVSYGGKTGYVSGSYLTTSPSGSTTITTKTGTATENLNLRNQASLSGKILTTIPKGKTVTILSEKDENGWYKVSYDGKTGYAISNYIKEDDSNSEATESAPSKPTVSKTGTTTENLNLRNQASLSGKVLMTIPKGKTVTILSEKDENGWYKVSYDGKTGYAISNYIKEGDSNSESTDSTASTPIPIEGQPTENLNLRDQPGTSGKILTTIPKGKTVTILSEKNANGWYKVSYNGKTGYVSGSYFKVTKYEELEETVIWTGTVNTNESIVYKTADTSATTLTTYHAGQKVEVVKVQGDWVRIKYNDTYAWMLKKVVTQGNLPNSTILWDGEIGKDTKLYATKSTTSTVLNSLTKGTVVYVIEEDGDWLKIKHHDGYGYVQRVTVINLSIPTIPENILWTGKTTENLNVRNYPDVSGILLGTLTKGTIIEVVSEDSKGWLKIKYEHGYGYVNGSYVQKDDSQTPETPETTKQIAYVYNLDGGTLNVRPQPNTSQAAIGKLAEGEVVTIVGESGNWYEIEYNNSTGYVSKDYITFNKPNQHPDANIDFETTPRIGVVIDSVTSLNIRQEATTNSVILGTLTAKDEVSIIGRFNDFYKISYDDSYAYVHKDYVGVKATSNLNGRVSYLTTEYSYSLTKFAQIQQSYTSGTIQSITSYLNPNNPANVNYLLQYLRIDQFRSFDVAGLNKELQNKGVLHNQGQIFYNASRYYNIDPIFFVSQSIHETNWGTSNLAKGITITEIADENKPIKDSSGKIIDYERIQLDKPVTVYNLFGIGARDHAPRLLGTTYAYKKGWTTPEKAIFGAAEFISLNYINSPKYQQNTPFKIKYNQLSANQWHQYATTPWYAYEIGNYMHRFAYLYDDDQEFLLDIPVYK